MADFVFNISKGRAAELVERVAQNDPSTAVLTAVLIDTSETDANLKDLDDLAAVLGNVNTAEIANTGYARQELTDADISAISPDDGNDQMDVDIPDIVFPSVDAGDNPTDVVLCYDGAGAGTDADMIVLTQHDYAVTPDGSDLEVTIPAAGFYRAS